MKKYDKHKFSQTTRRSMILGGLGVTIGVVLTARLYHLQFLMGDRYKTQAETNRIKLHLTPPSRGVITDRQGIPVATNEQNFRMLLQTDQVSDIAATLKEIHALTPLDEQMMEHIIAQRKPRRFSPPVLLKEFLTWDEVARIEFHSASIPGLVIEVGQVRYYPYGEALSHILGYVGIVTEKDLDDRELLKLPNFKVGRDGLEKSLESQLRGIPGVKEVEVNVHGLAVRELNTRQSIPGKEVHLTIDSRLQNYAYDLMNHESAACVVMDVERGDILTLMSGPAFDPNRFSKGITKNYWNELRANKKVPLMNKAMSGQYPPGSTFKMVVGLAALKAGVIKPTDKVHCPGHFFLGRHRWNCWKPEGHGSMDYRSAIAQSCDTYFYTVAQRMGIDNLAEMAHAFGLGEYFDLKLSAQRSGLVPTPAWKRKSYKQSWQAGDTINASIGQGYMLATPLQLAVMTARIANGGYAVQPRLVIPETESIDSPLPEWPKIDIDDEFLKAAQEGMWNVCNSGSGTAFYQRIRQPAYAMSGKSGTSQVRRITVRGQDQNTIPWEFRHHALFVAYAPADKPKYACGLIVEHGGGGSSAAAPYVRDILLKAQQINAGGRSSFEENSPDMIDPETFIGPMPLDAPTPARATLPWQVENKPTAAEAAE